MAFTYLQFYVAFLASMVFVLVPTAVVSRPRAEGRIVWPTGDGTTYWKGVAILVVVALAYTSPWDNYLIARGVWHYGEEVVAARIWNAPLEEYLFIMIQPVLTGLILAQLSLPEAWAEPDGLRSRPRVFGVGAAAAVGVTGAWLLTSEPTFYLGAILAWAAPVLALQWAVGIPQLFRCRRTVALGTLVPALYLCVVDRIAIATGIWILSERYTTGLTLLGLPIEEAVFFVVTNLFVVQGLVLYRWVLDRWWAPRGAERTPTGEGP